MNNKDKVAEIRERCMEARINADIRNSMLRACLLVLLATMAAAITVDGASGIFAVGMIGLIVKATAPSSPLKKFANECGAIRRQRDFIGYEVYVHVDNREKYKFTFARWGEVERFAEVAAHLGKLRFEKKLFTTQREVVYTTTRAAAFKATKMLGGILPEDVRTEVREKETVRLICSGTWDTRQLLEGGRMT